MRTFSGLHDRSEVTTTTSVTRPALSQSLAVSTAALPDAHMADTPMHGPVNPRSCMSSETGVDGMSSMYFLRGRSPWWTTYRSFQRSTSPSTKAWTNPTVEPGTQPRPMASSMASRAEALRARLNRLDPSAGSPPSSTWAMYTSSVSKWLANPGVSCTADTPSAMPSHSSLVPQP